MKARADHSGSQPVRFQQRATTVGAFPARPGELEQALQLASGAGIGVVLPDDLGEFSSESEKLSFFHPTNVGFRTHARSSGRVLRNPRRSKTAIGPRMGSMAVFVSASASESWRSRSGFSRSAKDDRERRKG